MNGESRPTSMKKDHLLNPLRREPLNHYRWEPHATTSEAAHPGGDREDLGEDREEETLPNPRVHRDPQHEAPLRGSPKRIQIQITDYTTCCCSTQKNAKVFEWLYGNCGGGEDQWPFGGMVSLSGA
eukprot:s2890_g4.t1